MERDAAWGGGGVAREKKKCRWAEEAGARRSTRWRRRKRNSENGGYTGTCTFKYTYVPTRLFILVAARRIAAEGQDRVNLPLVVYRSQYSVV